MGKIGFSLILTLALVTLSTSSERKCVLSGSWRSSVGCKMVVSELSEAGAFSGSYLSAAMSPKADRLSSRLHGIQHDASPTEQPTFGFTVKWQFSESPPDSMSVFVGQCFVDDQGEETLQTMWLLRQEVGSPGADWKATRVGTNVFTRIKGQNMGKSMRSDCAW
ncbi:avidin-like isoform X2 [Chelonoidis abingdonii]|uniref:avidin-like isoform X2 n=1 Tax=Chelonoidis abingdonii TaxID=106734 RepID=UPI0013F2A3A5|nr:avidin-like [Chelonoidis abingdonii]